jgi:hypothetical protein
LLVVKKRLTVVGFYALMAFIALHNVVAHASTHVPGTLPIDYFFFHWNFWWIRHALVNGQSIYLTNYVMAPFTTNLAYHTLTAFWFPLWALLEPFVGTLVAMTIIFLATFTLTGYSFFLLLRREGVSIGLALVGGVILEIMPVMLNAVSLTNLNILGWFWLPTIMLLWGKISKNTDEPPRRRVSQSDTQRQEIQEKKEKQLTTEAQRTQRKEEKRKQAVWAVVLGIALYGMVMTDLQLPLFAVFVVVPYGVWTLWRAWRMGDSARAFHETPLQAGVGAVSMRARHTASLRLVALGMLAVGIALVLLWFLGPLPYMLSYDLSVLAFTPAEGAIALSFPEGYFWQSVTGYPVGYVTVPLLVVALVWFWGRRTPPPNPLPEHREGEKRGTHTTEIENRENQLRGQWWKWERAPRWLWLACVPIPLILAAGASVTIGDSVIPMPYRWLHALFGGMYRYPERFMVVFTIPAVIFSLRVLTPLTRRIQLPVTVILLLIVLGWANLYHPLPVQLPPPPYEFYEALGREPYDYVIVDVPTAGSSGQGLVGNPLHITTEFYILTHGKRVINGHFSRVDTWQFMYMRDGDAMMSWLGQRRLLEPEIVEQQMRERIFSYPIGYFVLHQQFIGRNTPTVQEIVGYFNTLPDLLCPYVVEGDAIVYRTAWHPAGCAGRTPPQIETDVYQIDIGTAGDEFFIGWGWHWQEQLPGVTLRWTGEYPQALVYVDLPPNAYTLTMAAQAFWETRTVQILVNDVPVGEPFTVTTDILQEYSIAIPAELIGDGQHVTITLAYDAVIVPVDVGQSADTRRLAIGVDWLRFQS